MSGAPAAILAMPPGPPSAGAPASPSTAAPDPTGNGDAGAVRTFDDVLSQQTQVVGSPQHDHEHDGDQRGAKEGGSHGKHPASGAGTSMSGDAAAVDAAVLPIDGPSPFAVATPPAKGEASLTAAGDEDGLTVEAAGQASHDGSAPVTEQPNGVPNERVVAPGPAPVTTSGELTQADGALEAGAEAGANVSPEPPPVPMHPAGTSQASGHVPGENARAPFRPDTAAVAAVSSALPTPPSTTGPSATPLPTSHPGREVEAVGHALPLGALPAPTGAAPAAGSALAAADHASAPLDVDGLSGSISRPLSGGDGTYTVVVAMHPSDLGHMRAVMSLDGNDLQVSITPQNQAGHAALTRASETLRSQLAGSGLNVNVTLRDPGSSSGGDDQHPPEASGGPTTTDIDAAPRPTVPVPVAGQIHLVL